ncbi:pyroglutamyl-peptidase I family protein [Methylobacterium marchantiae]|uniref:Pyrrolidone-carboxylate peptidase n=1 Tax=Methylobacterium marchantiae TaxID=600331 RepID=A0ABW3WRU1_9HYPH|nr:Pyrrolidone-carboxylate peptidase [Methylobacterium marchantiae]
MTRGHLLVTGFGPFPGMPRNPSETLARQVGRIGRHGIAGFPLRTLILPTAYAAIPEMLKPALAERPAAVLMIGVAGRAKRVRVEARAVNRTSRLFPDASGRMPAKLRLDRDGPAQRRATIADRALVALRRHGVAAIPSANAGRYLCNASYFRALAETCPVLFLHIPPAKPGWRRRIGPALKQRDPSATLPRAVTGVGRLMLVAARRRNPA